MPPGRASVTSLLGSKYYYLLLAKKRAVEQIQLHLTVSLYSHCGVRDPDLRLE